MMVGESGMVAVGGVRYRVEDARALGLLSPGPEAAEEDGGGAEAPDGGGEEKAAPCPENKWRRAATKSRGGGRGRPA
mgnify:CR=1 FL=1|jgi:hypothetical protein|nr:MAG TPA: hypothetical protein [Caudoviricetes sp.]